MKIKVNELLYPRLFFKQVTYTAGFAVSKQLLIILKEWLSEAALGHEILLHWKSNFHFPLHSALTSIPIKQSKNMTKGFIVH